MFPGYITFPVDHLIPIPETLGSSPAVCPILCAGVTAYSALRKMNPIAGKWCAVAGAAGGVGHLAIQYAKVAFGMKVLAIDSGNRKAEFCTRLGADAFVDYIAAGKDLPERVKIETGGGADFILVLSPIQSAYK
jgi:propanol-preferring alcohol dehydrogenase